MFEVKSMAGIPSLMSKSVTSFLAALPSSSFRRFISADHDTDTGPPLATSWQKKHGGSWQHIVPNYGGVS